MSASAFSENHEICSTCRYWTGNRDINTPTVVYVEQGTEGDCTCHQSPFYGHPDKRNILGTCSNWNTCK